VGQHFPAEQRAPGQSVSSQQSELAMQPPPQRLKPPSHWNPHAPFAHVGVAFATAGHAVQRVPQELTLVSDRQRPPQSWLPVGHTPRQD
jgi:hypothetical protein